MKLMQAYKYQIKTNSTQERQLCHFAGSCRFVWNKALAIQKERLNSKKWSISYNTLSLLLPAWKKDYHFLADAPSQALQQVLKNLDRAIKDAFDPKQPDKGFPVFKKKFKNKPSIRFPQAFKLDQPNSRIYLPKIGWICYRNSRIIEGTPKNVTVSQSGGRWYISIQTEKEVEQPIHPSTSIIGIDVGIAKLATLSDGTVFEPVNSFKRHQQRLARYQRAMSRKQKFSSNWKKEKAKINKLHTRIANVRKDYLHKTTTIISKNHAIVCIEDLKIKNMSKSANGTIKEPGRNARAKAGLNRSILDQGWYELRRQLEYKELWQGGEVIAVPARNTSRKCTVCGHTVADNRTSQASFRCTACGHKANADVNAACNILAAGHAVLACGEIVPSDFSMNQEPTEAIQAYA